ncbi:MAG TPA: DUF6789 family protein [Gemmatimonadales bacterium]|nr:DUF6789 family protein [Gemmatimonadales bacterium]
MINVQRAALAGLAGTAVMTGLWYIEPKIGLAQLAVGNILSSLLAVVTAYASVGPAVGWAIHFAVGVILAWGYAAGFARRLPGPPMVRGMVYGLLVFSIAQAVFMPLVGGGVFSRGDPQLLMGSLLGHLVYGGVVGAIYGATPPAPRAA